MGHKKHKKQKSRATEPFLTEGSMNLSEDQLIAQKPKKRISEEKSENEDFPMIPAEQSSKKKKKRKRDDEDEERIIETPIHIEETERKEKKERKNKEEENGAVSLDTTTNSLSKKKKYKKKCPDDNEIPEELIQENSDVISKKKHKKKKKSKDPDTEEIMDEPIKKKRKEDTVEEHQNHSEKTDKIGDFVTVNEQTKKKKHKKKKHLDSDESVKASNQPLNDELSDGDTAEKHIKKKKKKAKESEADCEHNACTEENTKKEKKKKKDKSYESMSMDEVKNDIVANSKEIKTNGKVTERDKTETVDTEATNSYGQWTTATFESSDRQQKFMRLLGGFKKQSGSDNSTAKKLFSSTKSGKGKGLFGTLASKENHANYAMTVEQQKEMDAKLTSQYERALAFKFNPVRAGGLGYVAPPDEGKKFYINASATKSKKFDE